MRKILFRGKSVNTGEWIESMTISYGTIKRKRDNIFMEIEPNKWKGVDPKTIGQFTGLTDKNGKEIFEGDILHSMYEDKAEPSGVGHIYNEVAFRDGAFGWIGEITNDFFPFDGSEIKEEVIGNIHDNPELLTK